MLSKRLEHLSNTSIVDGSFLKPPWVNMISVNKTEEVEKLNLMPLTHRARFRRPSLERQVPFLDVPYPVF